MINKKEVKYVAKLARLGLTTREIEKFRKELSKVLDYINKLKKVDVSGVKPTSHPRLIENVMREDTILSSTLEIRKKLIEMAPQKKGSYIRTKTVF